MKIKKIAVKNFKSFNDIEIEFGDFNVLIGANASGKSNIISVFQFIKNISAHGLRNAISMGGGAEYLNNFNNSKTEMSFSIIFDVNRNRLMPFKDANYGADVYELQYNFVIKFDSHGDFSVIEDEVKYEFHVIDIDEDSESPEIKYNIGAGSVKARVYNGILKFESEPDDLEIDFLKFFPFVYNGQERSKDELLLNGYDIRLSAGSFAKDMIPEGIGIYDINTIPIKNNASIAGKTYLEHDGNNLAIVLFNLLSHKEEKRKYINLLNDILPFINDVKVDRRKIDGSLLLKMKESYSSAKFSPSFILSDGTINIAALIITLFFERKALVIIEEPEKGIHPYLMRKLVSLMKDAARKKQVIVTTQNPEMIKHAGLENILLVSRDDEGFTTVSKAADVKAIQEFLNNEIGIQDLMIQNII